MAQGHGLAILSHVCLEGLVHLGGLIGPAGFAAALFKVLVYVVIGRLFIERDVGGNCGLFFGCVNSSAFVEGSDKVG